MSTPVLTDEELLAYLDEMLSDERSAEVEKLLRERSDTRQRAILLARRRETTGHTVGEIWRRRQVSCPSRETLGSYLLGIADPDLEDYIVFHTDVVGCRICQANISDLRSHQQASEQSARRHQRYFESSAGLLRSQSPTNGIPSDDSED